MSWDLKLNRFGKNWLKVSSPNSVGLLRSFGPHGDTFIADDQ